MKHLKTFESFNHNDILEEGFLDKAKQAFGIKSKTEKIKLFFEETRKGIISEGLRKAFNDLKEQDSTFPIKSIMLMAPNLTNAILKNDKSSISKITEEEIAKVLLQSKTVKLIENEWEGTGRGSSEGPLGKSLN